MKNEDDVLTRVDTTGNAESSRTASTNEKAPRILTIDRSKWRRGGNHSNLVDRYGSTRLLNDKGLMCCLGFDAIACGVPASALLDTLYPSSLVARDLVDADSEYATTRTNGAYIETPTVERAISHNDCPSLTDSEREELIRADLIALGWDDVVFVGEGMSSDARPTDSESGKAVGSATKESEVQ